MTETAIQHFEGPSDDESRQPRLSRQHEAVLDVMKDGNRRTLQELSDQCSDRGVRCPLPSASAQLRHLRKPRFGAWTVNKYHVGSGLYEYELVITGESI